MRDTYIGNNGTGCNYEGHISVTTVQDVNMRDTFTGTGSNYEGHISVITVPDVIMRDAYR